MRLALLATLALFITTATSTADAANWPNWRGPTQNGVSTDKGIPAEFGPGKNVAWKVKLPGPGGASPVVWDDQVYVTSVEDQKLLLQAWSTAGKLKWQQQVGTGNKVVRRDEGNSASPSPVTDGKHVWAMMANGEIACYTVAGKLAWKRDTDIYGTTLAVSDAHGVVVMSYQNSRFKLDSELGGRLTAFATDSGEPLWDRKADYQSRLTLMDRTVVADGGAWDLLSGQPQEWKFSRSYGCGVLSGGKNMVFFRSATLGYFDLAKNDKVQNFGGVRPGCWINAIPAGGLVLVPDAAAGCSCSYLNRSWFALEPTGE